MPNKEKNRSLINDAILIGSLLLIGLAAFFCLKLFSPPGGFVVVEVEGKETHTYPLNTPVEVMLESGGNVLVIEDGKAYVKDCTCPDKLCEKQGKIQSVGESITCLPNRTHVRVVGQGDVDISQ